ncbi:MAG: hypothetical protein JRE43_07280 [Deltaproteobacteria bacterium]|jgi:hypothetical protein|nr:hypothetical protein [Deltaproteobacteria bacterium]MBW2543046.1 hypothetical protein [Deltaproteobacteria bacterium]
MIDRKHRAVRALVCVCATLTAGAALAQDDLVYRVDFEVRVVPTERAARVNVHVTDPKGLLRQVNWRIDPERHRDFAGGGTVEVEGDVVRWIPEPGVTTLRYVFRIDHLRDERSYDARCAENWAIFRGDDLVPPAKVRTALGARSASHLYLRVPDGWSAVAPYERAADSSFRIDNPHRGFDRPTGWLAVGRLGILRETVAGSRIAVAGPKGQRLQRLDILALLRWTLPTVRDMVGELPDRLLVVTARDPMWRGGLSGPRSAFVHASRPLISDDGTSPVLHELVHAALGFEPGDGGDWIVEGLAELYSLEALVRSRTISRKRQEKVLSRMKQRAKAVPSLEVASARGEITDRAVIALRALDAEIREHTQDQRSLEDAVRVLSESRLDITTAQLKNAAEQVSGADLSGFFRQHVGEARPGR